MLSFRPIQQFRGHTDVIHRTTFLPQEDSIFASCSSDGTLRTWATTPQVPRPPPKVDIRACSLYSCEMPHFLPCQPTAVHIGRSWVNLAWPYPAAFNDELTAFFVRWRRGEDGDYDESISVAGTTTQTAIQCKSIFEGSDRSEPSQHNTNPIAPFTRTPYALQQQL
jgi:WD40 repeat protein